MKKVLSLVLVIAMVLSSMSVAFAATFSDIADDNDYAEAIKTLEALSVITGYEDGTYKPEKTVTRAEMAKLMVQLLGYGDLVTGQKSSFTDTQGHWADQWIALAAGRGIVVGTGNGKFDPERTVSYDEVLTMLVRGLGYTDSCNELKNMTWPTNFKVKAAELNITKNVNMSSTGADRGGVAQAMYNSLDQQLVKVNSDGDIVREYTSVGNNDKIPVNLVSRIAIPDYAFEVGFEHIDPADKNYAGDKVDLSQYLFQTVEAYFNKNDDKEVVYVGDVDSLTYKGTFEDETFGKNGKLDTLEIGDYVFDVSSALVSYNNDEAKIADFEKGDLEDAKFTVVLDDKETRVKDDAVAKGLVIEKASAYVQVEEEYKADATEIDDIYLPVKSNKVDTANLIVKGEVSDLDDIKVDDIVAAYAPFDNEDPTIEAPDKLTLVVSRKTVEGEVTGTKGSDRYIDRVLYEVNDALNMDELERGDVGTFYLDDDGKIIAFSGDSEGSKTYAVVDDDVNINGEFKKSSSTGRYSVTEAPEIKIDAASGDTITYKFDIELDSNGKIKNEDIAKLFKVELNADGKTGTIEYIGASLFEKVGTDSYGKLVSYTLDKDNEISKFATAGRTIKDVSTNSSSFVLASNVVIFDREGNIIKEADLGSKVTGTAVYQNGKIVALLTDKSAEGTKYFAYVSAVNDDMDADKNDVQRLTAFVKGAKDTKLFTDDDDVVKSGKGKYYELEINDNGLVIAANTVADSNFSKVVTASAIDAKAGEVTIDGKVYFFDEGAATIIKFNDDGDAELVGKLSAIKKDDTKFKFLLTGDAKDRVIGYIVIQ